MKPKINTKLVLTLVIIWSLALTFALVHAKSNSDSEVKAGHLLIAEPAKSGSFFISANISSKDINQNEYTSPVLRADFPFNALFVKWKSNSANTLKDFSLYVRFLNENWSDWQEANLDDDYNGKDTGKAEISSQMLITKLTDSFQYKIVFSSKEARTNLNNLDFIYLDSTKGPKNSFKISLNSADDDLHIISRAQWGADESWRFDATTANLWPEEYYTPKKFVIHHTAGENANADPKATIRAIYYYHAKIRGWGDIGYNYLIDAQGNIYQGRYGGEAVVGGHAYLNNRNSIGIAILGCYDNNSSNCNTADHLTDATKTALNKLIAKKAQEFNIDPLGQSEFHGKILPNVIGHRDVGNTTCPGNLIYESLTQTRQLAFNLLQEYGGYKKPLPSAAQFVRQSAQEINIEETKSAEVVVEYKNIGQEVWRGYEDNYLYLTDSQITNKITKIDTLIIALASDKDEGPKTTESNFPVYKLQGGNVYPGETGIFKLVLNSPSQKTETKKFILAWQDKGYFPNTDFAVTLNKIACTTCGQNNAPVQINNQATLLQSTFPVQMSANELKSVILKFTNAGNQAWNKNQLKLKITYDNNLISPFKNDSWFDEFASIIPNEDTIYPGSIATLEFKLKAPNVLTSFPHNITLTYAGQKLYETSQTIDVISPYAAQITVNTLPQTAKRSSRPKIKLTFKNTGTKAWNNIILKSTDIDGTNSWFKDWSWLDKKTIKKIKKTVEPGQEITFEFRLLSYWKTNKYPHVYKLFDGQSQIYLDGKKEFLTYTQITK